MAPQKLRIAVMLEAVQLSDVIGADLFGNISQQYVKETSGLGLPDFSQQAPDIEFFYPATTVEHMTFMTPNIVVKASCTYDECPKDLDILLIGGPMLTHRPKEADQFMKEAFPHTKIVMTTCIGSMWLASSGVMGGMKATTNRECLPIARSLYPEIDWQDQRWVVDGKLWTSGGAGAGVDMVATYMLQNFDKTLVNILALGLLDFDPDARGQFYKRPIQYSREMMETDWKAALSKGKA